MPPHLTLEQTKRLELLLQKYNDMFNNTSGKLDEPPVTIHLKPGATPIFARAREILIALRDTYAKEIDTKLASGFYKKVEHSMGLDNTHCDEEKRQDANY